jgi:hypothetical protein
MGEKEGQYTVLNPCGIRPEITLTPPNPRVADLSGKTVYCLSLWVAEADVLLKKVADHLAEYAPGVKTVLKFKRTFSARDQELMDEIAEKADALICGCGG